MKNFFRAVTNWVLHKEKRKIYWRKEIIINNKGMDFFFTKKGVKRHFINASISKADFRIYLQKKVN